VSGSESCSTFEKAAKAVHHSRRQRKLFIRTSTSGGSSSKSCSLLETSTPAGREFNRSPLGAYSARMTCSLSRANQCEEAPHCTAGWTVQVHCSLFASLLESKQEEKICVHNIPEGGV
jgi:hypothetical protein